LFRSHAVFTGSKRGYILNNLEGITILIADDSALNNHALKQLLEMRGANVQAVENGQTLLDTLVSQPTTFDIVLTDIEMPIMDGLQAVRLIREYEQFASLPIVALSANAQPDDQWQCFQAGMDAHIAKPIELHKVCETILSFCPVAAFQNSGSKVRCRSESNKDLKSQILDRFDNNIPLIQKMLALYNEEFHQQLELLRQSNNQGSVRATLHAIKGLASTIGATDVLSNVNTLSELNKKAELTATQLNQSIQNLTDIHTQNLSKLHGLFNLQDSQIGSFASATTPTNLSAAEQQIIHRLLGHNDLSVISYLAKLIKCYPHDALVAKLYELADQLKFKQAVNILNNEEAIRLNLKRTSYE